MDYRHKAATEGSLFGPIGGRVPVPIDSANHTGIDIDAHWPELSRRVRFERAKSAGEAFAPRQGGIRRGLIRPADLPAANLLRNRHTVRDMNGDEAAAHRFVIAANWTAGISTLSQRAYGSQLA